METLQVTDLHYTYPATEGEAVTDIFQGLDLTIPHGSFVAILGHNGCGKSTLAKHFNAILLPSGGSVQVYGMDTAETNADAGDPAQRRHGVPEPG